MMIFMLICFTGYIAVSLVINKQRLKKLGKSVLLSNTKMEKNEIVFLSVRSILSMIVALILMYGSFIEYEYVLNAMMCFLGFYSANILFPCICSTAYKDHIGVYDNGVFAFGGIMEFSKMKEYKISAKQKKNHTYMSVYCISTFPLRAGIKNFTIDNTSVKEIHAFFKKKHRDLKKAKYKRK